MRLRRGGNVDYFAVDDFRGGYVVRDSRANDYVFASGNIIGTVGANHPILVEYGVSGITGFDGSSAEKLQEFLAEYRRPDYQNAEWLEPMFDVNSDDTVNYLDMNFLVESVLGTLAGDANLDGDISFADFLTLSSNFQRSTGWSGGDFDYSGDVDFQDFLILSSGFGSGELTVIHVPEPSDLQLLWVAAMVVFFRRHGSRTFVNEHAFESKP